jgi:thiol-disulfide isomerase/thioredoxin
MDAGGVMIGLLLACAQPPADAPIGRSTVQVQLGAPERARALVTQPLAAFEGGARAGVRLGDDRREVVVAPDGDGWYATVDVDADGVVERFPLVAGAGGWFADVEVLAPDPGALPYVVGLGRTLDGQLQIARPWESAAGTATVGAGPVAVKVMREAGGSYTVGVDVDRDGVILAGDRLGQRPSGATLALDGLWWRVEVSPGPAVTLVPVAAGEGPGWGLPAPELSLTDLSGAPVGTKDPQGRAVLLDFWATWCRPCLAQQPEVAALAERRGVAVIGVAADPRPKLEAHLATHPVPWPVVAGAPGDDAHTRYGVGDEHVAWGGGYPTYALIDPDGTLRALGALDTIRAALAR